MFGTVILIAVVALFCIFGNIARIRVCVVGIYDRFRNWRFHRKKR